MPATQYDLYVEQGANFYTKLTFQDQTGSLSDLTGYTFAGQIRKSISDTSVVATFTFNIMNQVSNKGELEVTLTAVQTAGIVLDAQVSPERKTQEMCYDIERTKTSTSFVDRILEGIVNISPEVTR